MQKTFVRKKSESLLNENDKPKVVTLATYFDLKIRQMKIAFLLLLECSRSASRLLSRTTASPASWLPAAIQDIATCRLMETQQQKRLKRKKMLRRHKKRKKPPLREGFDVSSGNASVGYHLEHFVMRDTLAIVAVRVGIGTCASTEKTNA